MVIEINKSNLSEHWITGDNSELINHWREVFFMTHNSIIHYLGKPKPMVVFPITYIPNGEHGILFDRIFVIDPEDSVDCVSTGIVFVNKEFLTKCIPENIDPKEFFFNRKSNLTQGFLKLCEMKHGTLFVGVTVKDRGIINEESKSSQVPTEDVAARLG